MTTFGNAVENTMAAIKAASGVWEKSTLAQHSLE